MTETPQTPIEWIGDVPNTNFNPGRSGNPIALVVMHWMAGSFDSAVARFRQYGTQVSAHYLIRQDGHIAQMVRDNDTAYHAGDWSTNQLSIGIEHEASPTMPPTSALYASSAWLLNRLAGTHALQLVLGETVLPHHAIVPTACPGTLDLERIVNAAKEKPVPRLIGQGADLVLRPTQVGTVQAIYAYPSHPEGRAITRKVVAGSAGRRVITLYPPIDPDADETLDLDSEAAIFVVDVTV